MLTFAGNARTRRRRKRSSLWGSCGSCSMGSRRSSRVTPSCCIPHPVLRFSHLADRARHCLCLVTRRKTGCDPGAPGFVGSSGMDALGVRRIEVQYFIFTDPLIILAGAILLDLFGLPSLSQMGFSDRNGPFRVANCCRSGRAGQICLHAQGPGTNMRMEPELPSAAAVTLVPFGPSITAVERCPRDG